jgi:F0F1-type ATP synthase assembly protein I
MDKNLPQEDPNEKRRKQSFEVFARYSGLAAQIAVAVTLGILGGKWLDKHFHMAQPVFTGLLAMLGVFIGLYLVFKDIFKK